MSKKRGTIRSKSTGRTFRRKSKTMPTAPFKKRKFIAKK